MTINIDITNTNAEAQSKIDELKFNISEEERLTKLIQDPPVQYRYFIASLKFFHRKHQKQQKLKEELKVAQRKIYDLNFYLKSNKIDF